MMHKNTYCERSKSDPEGHLKPILNHVLDCMSYGPKANENKNNLKAIPPGIVVEIKAIGKSKNYRNCQTMDDAEQRTPDANFIV